MRKFLFITCVLLSWQLQAYECDGRTRCGRMTSCEEATWFINNCPGMEMDGDHDGIPCESQWCNGDAQRGQSPLPEKKAVKGSDPFVTDPIAKRQGDDAVSKAFRERASDVQMLVHGQVLQLLPDDNEGGKHQRFLLLADSGVSVLVAHNIDLAPRIQGLHAGDELTLYGEYEWNEKGGVLHWTHRDPAGQHKDGWIRHQGQKYQ